MTTLAIIDFLSSSQKIMTVEIFRCHHDLAGCYIAIPIVLANICINSICIITTMTKFIYIPNYKSTRNLNNLQFRILVH